MIEEKAKANGYNLRIVNTNVYDSMRTATVNKYLRDQFRSFYSGITDTDCVLCPILHGDHWCRVVIYLKEKRMMYLDSLYEGIGAKTAFERISNFMEFKIEDNGRSRVFDGNEWGYYAIPATDLPQQTSSVDCGIFIVKWAQHIAEGKPIDFSQAQMNDFRYSLIIDIYNNKLSDLQISELCSRKNKGPSRPPKSLKTTLNVPNTTDNDEEETLQIRTPEKHAIEIIDSDSDFEPPKKSGKGDEGKRQPIKYNPSTEEHSYAAQRCLLSTKEIENHLVEFYQMSTNTDV